MRIQGIMVFVKVYVTDRRRCVRDPLKYIIDQDDPAMPVCPSFKLKECIHTTL